MTDSKPMGNTGRRDVHLFRDSPKIPPVRNSPVSSWVCHQDTESPGEKSKFPQNPCPLEEGISVPGRRRGWPSLSAQSAWTAMWENHPNCQNENKNNKVIQIVKVPRLRWRLQVQQDGIQFLTQEAGSSQRGWSWRNAPSWAARVTAAFGRAQSGQGGRKGQGAPTIWAAAQAG